MIYEWLWWQINVSLLSSFIGWHICKFLLFRDMQWLDMLWRVQGENDSSVILWGHKWSVMNVSRSNCCLCWYTMCHVGIIKIECELKLCINLCNLAISFMGWIIGKSYLFEYIQHDMKWKFKDPLGGCRVEVHTERNTGNPT